MRDPRASKRRRVSTEPEQDDDGDVAMDGGDSVYSVPSSPEPADSEDQDYRGPKRQPSRRQSTRRKSQATSAVDLGAATDENAVDTPSRAGTRSSGRQRKAPERFEDAQTPTSAQRGAATPRSGRPARSAQKKKPELVEDEDEEMDLDGQSPEPVLTRTRSRRTAAKPKSKAGEEEQPDSPDYNDGLDDLVALQLQQGLVQNQPAAEEEMVEMAEPLPGYAEAFQSVCQNGLQNETRVLTNFVLEKLSGKRQIPLKGLDSEYTKVNHLIEQTVTVGEGNSMLLLGSRGAGKTAMVESIISNLSKEHSNDFHVVRLNGFLHTDDRLALREMWRQLGRETHTEDDAAKELFGASGNKDSITAAKSIVILLDEFDLFVTHPRQTLLYNLFDIAQARKAPIAVIGLTTKVDVTEMLEKRVKSRFSHRYVYVPLPRTFEMFSDICLASLDLNDSEITQLADSMERGRALIESAPWRTLLAGWKSYLKELWVDKDFQFHMKNIFYQTKSVKDFLTSVLLPISELNISTLAPDTTLQVPTPKSFTSQSLSCPDPAPLPFSTSIAASASPSSLPLALLLAATRLAALFDPVADGAQAQGLAPLALSFPAAYAEYVRMLTSAKTSASVSGAAATPGRVWGRDVARESWENLISWGLVTPVGGGNGTADGQMFRVEISFEEVVEMAGSSSSLGQWWREG
ncbi:hypothetical protein N7470_001401 [Penicillium chermesinum]|nr:hypothetical protein N7470_001401 [Penicillium chermesinum]